MQQKDKEATGGLLVLASVLLNTIVLKQGFIVDASWYSMFAFTLPLLAVSIFIFSRR